MKIKSPLSNASVWPSDLIKEYLSSSNAKKVSLDPQETAEANLLPVILTVNVFLIDIDASVKSTLEILVLGRTVYKVLSDDVWRSVCNILRSSTWVLPVLLDNPPLTNPDTVVTPTTSTVLELTVVTLAYVGYCPVVGSSQQN